MNTTMKSKTEKEALGIVVNRLTKAMDAAAAGPVGVEGVPVILAHNSSGHFFIEVICVKVQDCDNIHCKTCNCDPIHCQLEVRQTEGSAQVAKKHEEAVVDALYELVHKALVAIRLDFAVNEEGN